METTAPSNSQIFDLPTELLELFISRVTKRCLKSLRLTSRKGNEIATPVLFRDLTIYPHLDSLEILQQISIHANISQCLKVLTYKTPYRALHRIPPRYFVIGKVKNKSLSNPRLTGHQKKLRQLREKVVMGGNLTAELTQAALLATIFARLPNLQALFIDDTAPTDRQLPEFYKTKTQGMDWTEKARHRLKRKLVESTDPEQSYALVVMAAANKLVSLKAIHIRGIHWDDFLSTADLFHCPSIYRDALATLKTLELSTDLDEHHYDGDIVLNLQDLLTLACNLEHLTLCLRLASEATVGGERPYDRSQDELCTSLFRLKPSQSLRKSIRPKLTTCLIRRFDLVGIVCTASELESVFKQVSSSLRHLRLADVVLLPETSSGPRACLVKFFKWMQHSLQLESLEVSGFFSNAGMQDWIFADYYKFITFAQDLHRFSLTKEKALPLPGMSDGKLGSIESRTGPKSETKIKLGIKYETERFVVEGGVCPLDRFEISQGWFDLGKKAYQKMVPDMLQDPYYEGDDTLLPQYVDDDDVPSDLDDETGSEAESETDTDDEGEISLFDQDAEDSTDWETASDDQ